MSEEKTYYDADGNKVSLDRLIRMEPSWARNRIMSLDAQVEQLTKELNSLLKAKSFGITIPSSTMEQEFGRHYRHGKLSGIEQGVELRKKLVAALKPFADCCTQHIDPTEDDEEWAKFRLLIKNYRAAADVIAEVESLECVR